MRFQIRGVNDESDVELAIIECNQDRSFLASGGVYQPEEVVAMPFDGAILRLGWCKEFRPTDFRARPVDHIRAANAQQEGEARSSQERNVARSNREPQGSHLR